MEHTGRRVIGQESRETAQCPHPMPGVTETLLYKQLLSRMLMHAKRKENLLEQKDIRTLLPLFLIFTSLPNTPILVVRFPQLFSGVQEADPAPLAL